MICKFPMSPIHISYKSSLGPQRLARDSKDFWIQASHGGQAFKLAVTRLAAVWTVSWSWWGAQALVQPLPLSTALKYAAWNLLMPFKCTTEHWRSHGLQKFPKFKDRSPNYSLLRTIISCKIIIFMASSNTCVSCAFYFQEIVFCPVKNWD